MILRIKRRVVIVDSRFAVKPTKVFTLYVPPIFMFYIDITHHHGHYANTLPLLGAELTVFNTTVTFNGSTSLLRFHFSFYYLQHYF